jgi:integrase
MAMLFVRTGELLEAPLSEFDLENARWVITPERMKMDRPHIVPLPRQAVAILRELFHSPSPKTRHSSSLAGPTHIKGPSLLYAEGRRPVRRGYGKSPEVFC